MNNPAKRAAQFLRWARNQKPRAKSAWDLAIVAGTKAREQGDLGAYYQIREVAIKFPPTANFYLG